MMEEDAVVDEEEEEEEEDDEASGRLHYCKMEGVDTHTHTRFYSYSSCASI